MRRSTLMVKYVLSAQVMNWLMYLLIVVIICNIEC